MAIIQVPFVRVTLSMKDRGRTAHTSFRIGEVGGNLPNHGEIGHVNAIAPFTFIHELFGNFADVSDCAPVGYEVTYSWYDDTQAYPAGGNPNVERKGLFSFRTAPGSSFITVPGIKDVAVSGNGKDLIWSGDPSAPVFGGAVAGDLQSIHDKMRNGATVGATTFPVVNEYGVDYGTMLAAYQSHRASNGKG